MGDEVSIVMIDILVDGRAVVVIGEGGGGGGMRVDGWIGVVVLIGGRIVAVVFDGIEDGLVVVGMGVEEVERAGQFVTVGPQDVMVIRSVDEMVVTGTALAVVVVIVIALLAVAAASRSRRRGVFETPILVAVGGNGDFGSDGWYRGWKGEERGRKI